MFDEQDSLSVLDMHNMYRDENFGFTVLERKRRIRRLLQVIFLNLVLFANCFFVFFLFDHNDMFQNVIFHKEFDELTAIFIIFAFVFSARIIKSLYLIKIWKNLNQNPTIIEAKIEYYSQFSLGLIETIVHIIAICNIKKNDMI